MMQIFARHWKFLLIQQGLIPMVFNILLNGLIAWGLFHSLDSVPIWGKTSVAGDAIATAFLLPLLTALIVNVVVKKEVKSGKLAPLSGDALAHSTPVQKSAVKMGLSLGVISIIFGALPIVWLLSISQSQSILTSDFIVFKAVWAGMLAFMVTPVVGWWALINASANQTIETA